MIEIRKTVCYNKNDILFIGGAFCFLRSVLTMIELLSLEYNELRAFVENELGESSFRANQISEWICRGASIEDMTNLSKSLREKLAQEAFIAYPKIRKKLISKIDGTVKYLFEYLDGETVEGVLMRYDHGNTLCVSTQVGCRMGCRFCASTIGGKVRDLSSGEILGQVIIAQKESGERISNIVMMGIGEPLDNYDNVLRFIKLVSDEHGLNIGQRHISLSTSGLADKIDALANEDLQITLSVSLHAFDDKTRSSIMPVNNKWNIDVLLKACKRYFDKTGRRVSFEYTLINGKNDSLEGARQLSILLKRYFGKTPVHVNLIPVNQVSESSFTASGRGKVNAFCAELCQNGVNATVRRKLGDDISAACGQLRRREMQIFDT